MKVLDKRGRWVAVSAAITVVLFAAAARGAGGCKQEVVAGQSMEEVATICPSPVLRDHRDLWEEEWDGKERTRHNTTYDEWTFDSGPHDFMQSLVFLDGKLAEVRILGYGSMRDATMPDCRNGEGLAVGDTMADAYLKCGEPLSREKQDEKVVESTEGELTKRRSVAVMEWTYRYGRDLPGYTVRFENGTATDIRQREFGK